MTLKGERPMAIRIKSKKLTDKLEERKSLKDDVRYVITMHGNYFARKDQGTAELPYRVKCYMTHGQIRKMIPNAIFKWYIAPQIMKRLYTNYTSLASFDVAECECEDESLLANNIYLMQRTQLEEHIDEENMPIEPMLYDDIMQLRQAILDYKKDPEAFEEQQLHLYKVKKDVVANKKILGKIATVDELLILNGVNVGEETEGLPEVKLDKKGKKAVIKNKKAKQNEVTFEEVADEEDEDEYDLGV